MSNVGCACAKEYLKIIERKLDRGYYGNVRTAYKRNVRNAKTETHALK